MNLYRKNNGDPVQLPFSDYDAAGDLWTDLANNPDGVTACGYVEAPPQPDFDPATQAVRWDSATSAWVVEALPPPVQPTEVYVDKIRFADLLGQPARLAIANARKMAALVVIQPGQTPTTDQQNLLAFEDGASLFDVTGQVNLLDPRVAKYLTAAGAYFGAFPGKDTATEVARIVANTLPSA